MNANGSGNGNGGTPALTHHEIVELAEPFARGGLNVDLAASDRVARRVVFQPVDRPAEGEGPVLRETLALDCRDLRRLVLERTLAHPDGSQARLQVVGAEGGEMLARLRAIDPMRHFEAGDGFRIARSYELWAGGDEPEALLYLTRAEVRVHGLMLTLTQRMPNWRNVAADLALTPIDGRRPAFPEDLLAVLGWDWARLVPNAAGWTSKIRLRGKALRRSRTAERELTRAAQHLVRVTSEPPKQYHARHRAARWGVVLRRGIPALTIAGMVVGAVLMLFFADRENSPTGLWLAALNYVPLALLAVAFSLQELPRFEFPPLPAPRTRPSWWPDDVAPDAARPASPSAPA